MRKLLFVATGLILLMVVSVAAARGIGRSQSPPEVVRWWHFADCTLPCWGGFVVGNTPALEVEGRLNGLFPPPEAAIQPGSWQGRADLSIVLQRITDGQTIEQGRVSFRFANSTTSEVTFGGKNLPALGDVFTLLGAPSCVTSGIVGTNFLTLYYTDLADGQTIEIGISPHDWNTPIGNLVINQNSDNPCEKAFRWRGLDDAKRYRKDP